jgi:hypothetical protein
VDAEPQVLVVRRLSDSRYAAALEAARAQVADRLTAIRIEIADCEALQAALSERLGRRKIKLDAFDKADQPTLGGRPGTPVRRQVPPYQQANIRPQPASAGRLDGNALRWTHRPNRDHATASPLVRG